MEDKDVKTKKLNKINEIRKIKSKKIIIISIISVIIIAFIALICVYALDATRNTFGGKISSIFEQDKDITEEKAVTKALDRFTEMGEENLITNDLEVLKINRKGEYYYYISSPQNSLEIRISDGKIVRENSVLVEE